MSELDQLARALAAGQADWARQTEVLVAGAGLAGFAAALEAAHGGSQVMLLEKQPEIGGSTVLSGGAMGFAGTEEQIAQGIADSDERLAEDLLSVGGRQNDPALVATYVAHQRETHAWLKAMGVVFRSVQLGGGQSVPRSNRVDTRQMIGALAERAAAGVVLHTQAAVLRLVRGAEGRVLGAVVRLGGVVQGIRALGGVVLATGGFSRNEALLAIHAPAQRQALRIGGPGNVGDGLLMGCALGAGLRDMGYVRGTFGVHPAAGPEDLSIIHPIYKGAIAVNREGQRFTDESASYKIIGDACLQQPGGLAFQVFDAPVMAQSVPGVATSDMAAGLADGRIIQAPTLAALAEKLGLPVAAFEATVARYNADALAGRDSQFGRTGLAAGYGKLHPITEAPFYGFPSTSAVLATYAGLSVDPGMRVLDVFGTPIEGLFAAGEVIGGLHGAAYMTGSSLGKSAIFGRLAGRGAAGG